MMQRALKILAFAGITLLFLLILMPWHRIANYGATKIPGLRFVAYDSHLSLSGIKLNPVDISWQGYRVQLDTLTLGFSPFQWSAKIAAGLAPAGEAAFQIPLGNRQGNGTIDTIPLGSIFSLFQLPLTGGELFGTATFHPTQQHGSATLRILGPVYPIAGLKMVLQDLQLRDGVTRIAFEGGKGTLDNIELTTNQGRITGTGEFDQQGMFRLRLAITGDGLTQTITSLTGVMPGADGTIKLQLSGGNQPLQYSEWN
ncbi:hypothetical protein [Chrysiogenes arsenatis]|uniref:hypothetical protein n=1 Tax=Chrysiogenes arsenatis TaxID=309797 RepID=UPI0003F4C4A1|nr:hypothetical protein [Chrysiogenes arsenatis]